MDKDGQGENMQGDKGVIERKGMKQTDKDDQDKDTQGDKDIIERKWMNHTNTSKKYPPHPPILPGPADNCTPSLNKGERTNMALFSMHLISMTVFDICASCENRFNIISLTCLNTEQRTLNSVLSSQCEIGRHWSSGLAPTNRQETTERWL